MSLRTDLISAASAFERRYSETPPLLVEANTWLKGASAYAEAYPDCRLPYTDAGAEILLDLNDWLRP